MQLSGFRNHHQSEALAGALPASQNSPQHCPLGLYAEQISGTAFTCPRAQNLHSWVYRKKPSVNRKDFQAYPFSLIQTLMNPQPPNPLRFMPQILAQTAQDFIEGLIHIASNKKNNVYIYQCNQSMQKRYFSSYDGELLFVPYQGEIILATEFGELEIKPGMIAVIPAGIYFKLILKEETAAGYLCENMGIPFNLPELGPLGANSLANPRHFIYPQAKMDAEEAVELICKSQNHTWFSQDNPSPLNVAAWHGNYAPYSYDLSYFNTINTVSFDHPDPSIFTVLTSNSNTPGVANLDFVIFPARWMVAEHTFRPPYFHRNVLSELMGLIYGSYDAKQEGFTPGALSIHNRMTAHGPDVSSYNQAVQTSLQPEKLDNTLAFMFESNKAWIVSEKLYQSDKRDAHYTDCWQGFS